MGNNTSTGLAPEPGVGSSSSSPQEDDQNDVMPGVSSLPGHPATQTLSPSSHANTATSPGPSSDDMDIDELQDPSPSPSLSASVRLVTPHTVPNISAGLTGNTSFHPPGPQAQDTLITISRGSSPSRLTTRARTTQAPVELLSGPVDSQDAPREETLAVVAAASSRKRARSRVESRDQIGRRQDQLSSSAREATFLNLGATTASAQRSARTVAVEGSASALSAKASRTDRIDRPSIVCDGAGVLHGVLAPADSVYATYVSSSKHETAQSIAQMPRYVDADEEKEEGEISDEEEHGTIDRVQEQSKQQLPPSDTIRRPLYVGSSSSESVRTADAPSRNLPRSRNGMITLREEHHQQAGTSRGSRTGTVERRERDQQDRRRHASAVPTATAPNQLLPVHVSPTLDSVPAIDLEFQPLSRRARKSDPDDDTAHSSRATGENEGDARGEGSSAWPKHVESFSAGRTKRDRPTRSPMIRKRSITEDAQGDERNGADDRAGLNTLTRDDVSRGHVEDARRKVTESIRDEERRGRKSKTARSVEPKRLVQEEETATGTRGQVKISAQAPSFIRRRSPTRTQTGEQSSRSLAAQMRTTQYTPEPPTSPQPPPPPEPNDGNDDSRFSPTRLDLPGDASAGQLLSGNAGSNTVGTSRSASPNLFTRNPSMADYVEPYRTRSSSSNSNSNKHCARVDPDRQWPHHSEHILDSSDPRSASRHAEEALDRRGLRELVHLVLELTANNASQDDLLRCGIPSEYYRAILQSRMQQLQRGRGEQVEELLDAVSPLDQSHESPYVHSAESDDEGVPMDIDDNNEEEQSLRSKALYQGDTPKQLAKHRGLGFFPAQIDLSTNNQVSFGFPLPPGDDRISSAPVPDIISLVGLPVSPRREAPGGTHPTYIDPTKTESPLAASGSADHSPSRLDDITGARSGERAEMEYNAGAISPALRPLQPRDDIGADGELRAASGSTGLSEMRARLLADKLRKQQAHRGVASPVGSESAALGASQALDTETSIRESSLRDFGLQELPLFHLRDLNEMAEPSPSLMTGAEPEQGLSARAQSVEEETSALIKPRNMKRMTAADFTDDPPSSIPSSTLFRTKRKGPLAPNPPRRLVIDISNDSDESSEEETVLMEAGEGSDWEGIQSRMNHDVDLRLQLERRMQALAESKAKLAVLQAKKARQRAGLREGSVPGTAAGSPALDDTPSPILGNAIPTSARLESSALALLPGSTVGEVLDLLESITEAIDQEKARGELPTVDGSQRVYERFEHGSLLAEDMAMEGTQLSSAGGDRPNTSADSRVALPSPIPVFEDSNRPGRVNSARPKKKSARGDTRASSSKHLLKEVAVGEDIPGSAEASSSFLPYQ